MSLTKEMIDALWDAHRKRISGSVAMNREDTYLAAGLTATGERKPERVPLVQIIREDGRVEFAPPGSTLPKAKSFEWVRTTPGWFVPDGAE